MTCANNLDDEAQYVDRDQSRVASGQVARDQFNWRFLPDEWAPIEEILGPVHNGWSDRAMIETCIRSYITTHMNVAEGLVQSDREDAAAIESSLAAMSDFTKMLYGTSDLARASTVRQPIERAVATFYIDDEDDDEGEPQLFGHPLLREMRSMERILRSTLAELRRETVPYSQTKRHIATSADYMRIARNNVLSAAVRAYVSGHGKMPALQQEGRGGPFESYIRLIMDTLTNYLGTDPYPWGTLKSHLEAIRKRRK